MAFVVSGVFLFKERYFTKIWGTGIACNNKLRMEGIRGGHFEHGFFVGMASAAGGAVINGGMCDRLIAAERVAVNAALGGIVSEIGGGKFASGAMTGAYVMMFNELKHTISDSQLKKIYDAYTHGSFNNNGDWMEVDELCRHVGGFFSEIAPQVKNGCAIRLSYAMNKSGFLIPPVKGTYKGGDGKWYFIKALDMSKYLRKYRVATVSAAKYARNGLVYLHPSNSWISDGISGHVDVVYRNKWGSYFRYSNYYGGSPYNGFKNCI